MHSEVITIGNELLSGRTQDTNFAYLAHALERTGAPVSYHQTIGDQVDVISSALKMALKRSELIIVTGGLGPTPDDVTRKAIAKALSRPLGLNEKLLDQIRERWAELGGNQDMPPNNELQALVPRGARVLPNPVGSAPGLMLVQDGRAVFVFPGVPAEMEAITQDSLVPWVQEKAGRGIEYLTLRTTGIRESVLAQKLADLEAQLSDCAIAYLPSFGGVDVRIRLPELEERRTESLRTEARKLILERVARYVYGEGDVTLQEVIGDILVERGYKLAVAESCTGGLLAARFTSTAGSSRYFERGFVTYSNESKEHLVKVPHEMLVEHGAVSEPVARALAEGAVREAGVEVGIGITGIAGPDGGTAKKPVGTVHIAVLCPEGESHRALLVPGSRENVRKRSVMAAMELARRLLLNIPA